MNVKPEQLIIWPGINDNIENVILNETANRMKMEMALRSSVKNDLSGHLCRVLRRYTMEREVETREGNLTTR